MDEGGVPPETGGYDAEEDLLPGSSSSSEGRRKRRRKTKSARHHHQKVTRISSPAPRIMDGDLAVETCHFHWPNHLPHILASFEALLTEETFCDVTLICGDEMVPLRAHRLVLSACSDYFERILTENPCSQAVIVLKDFAVWEVEALLDWMYRGQVGVTEENGDALVSTAKSLQIRGLAESLLWHINPPSKIPKIDNFSPENSNPATTPLNLSRPTISSPNKEEQDPYHHSVPTSGLVSFQEENSPHNPLDFTRVQNHSPPPTRSSIPLPRRKQARPRRRSGDFIAQDLRKPSPASGFLSREQSDAEEHVAFRFDDDDDEEDDPFVFDEDFAHDHDPGMNDRSSLEGEVFSSVSPKEEEDENEEKFLRRTRRSSRFLYDDEYDEDDGEFEGHEILDYTMPPSNTLSSREERGTDLKQTAREERVLLPPGTVGNGSLHQQNLVFLRGYNPTMAQGGKFMNPGEIHHHHRNNNLNHHKGPFSPPVRSPFPLNADPLLASFPFLPGLLPPPPHLPLSSPTGKRNPSPLSPAPSLPPNSFLSTSGAIQITPLGGDPESPHKTTPTTNSSPAEFSPGGQTHESGSKQQVQSSSRNGGKQVNRNHYHHHHHPHWPGISPLGPPPIFGRHRAQHSAPRGGKLSQFLLIRTKNFLAFSINKVWNMFGLLSRSATCLEQCRPH
ncbi:uncharacterized protein LOC110856369 [Folsomia candida]|uniref:uncharacterized protein LOC110856369 n=1 Tax=Folsomia candida TaxID=158441 RepID=UPI0016055228|nr:uncharacterized protein LOC110856369 [Folsomia candida]